MNRHLTKTFLEVLNFQEGGIDHSGLLQRAYFQKELL